MLLINRLTASGGIKRVEIHSDTVKVVLNNGAVKVYTDNQLKVVGG